jgi:hypothetical protein
MMRRCRFTGLQLTIEDLTVKTRNLRVAADELNGNAGPAKVRSHGEISN